MATQTTWTKERYKEEITELYHQMKKHGWNKADCKRSIDQEPECKEKSEK